MAEERVYERGAASPEELQKAIDAFFAEARQDDELQGELEAHGADVDEALGGEAEAITVSTDEQGIDPLTAIVIGVAVHVGGSAWDEVVLPWLKRRLGQDALGDEKEPPA